MMFPVEDLIEFKGNMYEITCAASRRAYQLSMLGDEDTEDDKVVSLAAWQVFSGEVEFRVDEAALSEYSGSLQNR